MTAIPITRLQGPVKKTVSGPEPVSGTALVYTKTKADLPKVLNGGLFYPVLFFPSRTINESTRAVTDKKSPARIVT